MPEAQEFDRKIPTREEVEAQYASLASIWSTPALAQYMKATETELPAADAIMQVASTITERLQEFQVHPIIALLGAQLAGNLIASACHMGRKDFDDLMRRQKAQAWDVGLAHTAQIEKQREFESGLVLPPDFTGIARVPRVS